MSGEANTLVGPGVMSLDDATLKALFRHVHACLPLEACGWVVQHDSKNAAGFSVHCAVNQAAQTACEATEGRTGETAYAFSPEDTLTFARLMDRNDHPVLVFHSHPNGRAYFSDMDVKVATSPWGDGPTYPVTQLVVGVTTDRVEEAAQFGWDLARNGFVEIWRRQFQWPWQEVLVDGHSHG